MPCNTISRYSVELTNRNPAILRRALEAMGFTVTQNGDRLQFNGTNRETGQYHSGSYANGKLSYTGELNTNTVKQSYAAQVLEAKAKKYGWCLKKTGAYTYNVTKR